MRVFRSGVAVFAAAFAALAAGAQTPQKLPAAFIDSRPILAYFEDVPLPDTVRDLLAELNRSDTCGEGADLKPLEACALVFYQLDDDFTPDRLRPPLIIRAIYRVTQPENLADTIIVMPERSGELKRYQGGGLFHPLRDVRANMCLQDSRMPDQCRDSGERGVLYRPIGILGRQENEREKLLPAKSGALHFRLMLTDPERIQEQRLRDQMWDLCNQKQGGKPLLVC